mmetsp:Transcript_26276/g.41553  ORF Transcript_26276/g.41553 Transcript_26276/m.41553 type:complete len:222 (-) Transcript_26276:1116-1781(-)
MSSLAGLEVFRGVICSGIPPLGSHFLSLPHNSVPVFGVRLPSDPTGLLPGDRLRSLGLRKSTSLITEASSLDSSSFVSGRSTSVLAWKSSESMLAFDIVEAWVINFLGLRSFGAGDPDIMLAVSGESGLARGGVALGAGFGATSMEPKLLIKSWAFLFSSSVIAPICFRLLTWDNLSGDTSASSATASRSATSLADGTAAGGSPELGVIMLSSLAWAVSTG